jgi:hypothetical protein
MALFCWLFVQIVAFAFHVVFFLAHLFGFVDWLIKGLFGITFFWVTLGWAFIFEQRWSYEVAFQALKKICGPTFHRSIIKLIVCDLSCSFSCQKSKICSIAGFCETNTKNFICHRIYEVESNCDCLMQSIERALSCQRGEKGGDAIYRHGNNFRELFPICGYLGTPLLKTIIESYSSGSCMSLPRDGELHDPRYDVNRLMWMETKVT